MASRTTPRSRWQRPLLLAFLCLFTAVLIWTWWAEEHPREERQLRVIVHDRLHDWFPQAMSPDDDGWHGLEPRIGDGSTGRPRIVLVHGLDEPGSIWHDLFPVLDAAGFEVWEFRYPNDQGIDRSAQYLAEHWPDLPADRPAILIGHSMGGLVVREFVSRWRHPVGTTSRVAGAPVRGAILVGTPNHGSDWARLRIWLELRDQWIEEGDRRFSLFAALRDGTGEAKIDLRPGSDYLTALNATAWPEVVPIRLIGGVLLESPPWMSNSVTAIAKELPAADLKDRFASWWSDIGEGLGDGVVSLTSLDLPEAPPPILVPASHRGLLMRFLPNAPQPPAIAPILSILDEWSERRETSVQPAPSANRQGDPRETDRPNGEEEQ
ncbi:alpha/beta hydrolase [uncultured Thiocystis sp.]|uniref:esterase/lipase family protein n=1 Tax=uncultured Thiocystis sp. TaxID=1202134 RepID=UPI0025DA9033|nr:alpha/beta hydrolase [uncultured Thiocystis sp.]